MEHRQTGPYIGSVCGWSLFITQDILLACCQDNCGSYVEQLPQVASGRESRCLMQLIYIEARVVLKTSKTSSLMTFYTFPQCRYAPLMCPSVSEHDFLL